MDQDTVVTVSLAGGWRLIDALARQGYRVDVAFWARPSDEEKWTLYLASPVVDERGPGPFYQAIHAVLRDAPEWGVDPFSVVALAPGHPMAGAAADLVRPRAATGPFAVPNPKPYRGMTRFGGRSLGGTPVDGVYIYPPWEPGTDPVG